MHPQVYIIHHFFFLAIMFILINVLKILKKIKNESAAMYFKDTNLG